jgi:hypothetical protein
MRNREAIMKKIDSLETNVNKLNFALNKGDRELYNETFDKLMEQISQLRTYVESEPITGSEMNQI